MNMGKALATERRSCHVVPLARQKVPSQSPDGERHTTWKEGAPLGVRRCGCLSEAGRPPCVSARRPCGGTNRTFVNWDIGQRSQPRVGCTQDEPRDNRSQAACRETPNAAPISSQVNRRRQGSCTASFSLPSTMRSAVASRHNSKRVLLDLTGDVRQDPGAGAAFSFLPCQLLDPPTWRCQGKFTSAKPHWQGADSLGSTR